MSEHEQFLVFGSVVEGSRKDPDDIDLVVPEFTDKRMYSARVCLERYERLAAATGKPIDLFFTTYPEDYNLAAVYAPRYRWRFRQAFCGKGFFNAVRPMTFQQIVNEVEARRHADATPDKEISCDDTAATYQ
jgi:hypothetical protein